MIAVAPAPSTAPSPKAAKCRADAPGIFFVCVLREVMKCTGNRKVWNDGDVPYGHIRDQPPQGFLAGDLRS